MGVCGGGVWNGFKYMAVDTRDTHLMAFLRNCVWVFTWNWPAYRDNEREPWWVIISMHHCITRRRNSCIRLNATLGRYAAAYCTVGCRCYLNTPIFCRGWVTVATPQTRLCGPGVHGPGLVAPRVLNLKSVHVHGDCCCSQFKIMFLSVSPLTPSDLIASRGVFTPIPSWLTAMYKSGRKCC